MNRRNLLKIAIISLLFYSGKVNSKCNFNSSNYIDQLSLPNQIKEIKIDIPESKKFAKNSIRILVDRRENIRKRFKKKFNAKILVNYEFGECIYEAKVWQLGDWKDHISWNKTYPITSLNVKLTEGNILNAVKFKLLIPKTRYGLNEILGALILKNLNIISPETFETYVNINGNQSLMIFQEDSRKELLERNKRREGPIYEGDESIVWGNKKNSINFEYGTLALARLINREWFLKGSSSQEIVLNSFDDLQYSYLNAHQNKGRDNIILPNYKYNKLFEDYYFLLAAMNGPHGLTLHNRKFYFNIIENKFEPIYYDGNLLINRKININDKKFFYINAFSKGYYFTDADKIKSKEFKSKLLKEYKQRIKNEDKSKKIFFNDAYLNLLNNIDYLNKYLSNIDFNDHKSRDQVMREIFKKRIKSKNINQKIIKSYDLKNNEVNIVLETGEFNTLNLYEFSKVISGKKINKIRYLFLPKDRKTLKENYKLKEIYSKDLEGYIVMDPNINFELDKKNKKITIKQNSSNAWIMFKGTKINDWDITFLGNDNKDNLESNKQRFNKYGITGCLSFYETIFNNSSIKALNGKCEDNLNIINSKGSIKFINVINSSQDALDIDFSNIKVKNIEIKNAGNDCLDLSGGRYIFDSIEFSNCGDKGISVGEKSNLYGNNINISKSKIGLSVKDLSYFESNHLNISESNICIEAKLKKQEFGGGKVKLKEPICDDNQIIIDQSSSIEI